MYNPIAVVNVKNEPIGAVNDVISSLPEGQYRSASSVFVLNEKGEILLQRRSAHILSPGLLDKSVGGHVDVGETNEMAALREMKEELGIENVALTPITSGHCFEGYCVNVYKVVVDSRATFSFDTHEIDEVFWITPEELTVSMVSEPHLFTRNFVDVWQKHRDTIIL
jgi:isopentenyldiphosphate isomerase